MQKYWNVGVSRELLPKNLRPSTSDLEDADKENSELENSGIEKKTAVDIDQTWLTLQ